MSYIDDWGQTPAEVRLALEQSCGVPECTHPRYQHGDVRTLRNGSYKWVEHGPGKCTVCKCEGFAGEPPITKDDVLDVAVALRYEPRLIDIGIAPISLEKCAQLTIRHTGASQLVAACSLEANHPGEHEPDWSDLHATW